MRSIRVERQPGGGKAGRLAAVALFLGLGAAVLSGAAVAAADSDAAANPSRPAAAHAAGPASHRQAAAKPTATTTASAAISVRRMAPTVPVNTAGSTEPAPLAAAPSAATAKKDFYQTNNAQTSALTSAAMVMGQLTGKMPTLNSMIAEAMKTDSVVRTVTGESGAQPRKMYLGPKTTDYMYFEDGYALLSKHGIRVTGSFYPKAWGAIAQSNLTKALSAVKSAILVITRAGLSATAPGQVIPVQHAVTVLSVDTVKGWVYINDGALPNGKNLRLSMKDFMDSWQKNLFQTAIAERRPKIAQSVSEQAVAA
ncbi:MAG: hypothetical protein ACR2JM_13225 [Mycobacterium sp.]